METESTPTPGSPTLELKPKHSSAKHPETYEDALHYIALLEKTLKKSYTLNKLLTQDCATLAAQCRQHYNKVQMLMRYEFKVQEGEEKVIHGKINDGGEFTISRKQ